MAYSDDIRTIAKTQEILDKANKALKYAAEAKKEAIDTKRVTTNQVGNSNTGSNGSSNSTGTDAGGNPVQPPLAPPPTPKDDKNTDLSDLLGDKSGSSGSTSSSDPTKGSNSNDLSDKGKEYDPNNPSSGGSRSDAAKQADPYNKDADWKVIEDRLRELGQSDEYIADARRLYFKDKKGQHEIGDVAKGDAGPDLTIGSWTSFAPNSGNANNDGLSSLVTPIVDRLNAVVGVDPEDDTLGVMLRFDGRSVIPSLQESIDAGQSVWTDLVTPPAKAGWEHFEQGFYWVTTNPASAQAETPARTMDASIAAIRAIFPAPYPSGYGDADWDTGSLTGPDGSHNYHATWYQGGVGVGPPNNTTITRTTCDGPHASICPTTAQTENIWPDVGLYNLSWLGPLGAVAGIGYSIYDSRVPARYKGLSGGVQIKSAIDGNTYNIEPGIEGGFLIYNASDPSYMLYYGSDRTLRAVFPPEQVKFYLPKKAVIDNMPT